MIDYLSIKGRNVVSKASGRTLVVEKVERLQGEDKKPFIKLTLKQDGQDDVVLTQEEFEKHFELA